MITTLRAVEDRASSFLQVPITCRTDYGGGCVCEVTSPVFDKGRGLTLRITRPFVQRLSSVVVFDTFGTQLTSIWKKRSDKSLSDALRYLIKYDESLMIDARADGHRLSDDSDSISAIQHLSGPAGFTLRVARELGGEVSNDDLLSIIQCVFGFVFILSRVMPTDVTDDVAGIKEGSIKQTSLTAYERSRVNRMLCIAHHGAKCAVCGFDFAEVYGPFAAGYIEVHHKKPISQMGGATVVDPVADLVPLCPNCHAAVHMSDPPINPSALKDMIASKHRSQE